MQTSHRMLALIFASDVGELFLKHKLCQYGDFIVYNSIGPTKNADKE